MRNGDVDSGRFAAIHSAQPRTLEVTASPHPGPALQWPGKRLAVEIPAPRARLLERYTPAAAGTPSIVPPPAEGRLLLAGDNLQSLAWLLDQGLEGQVRLIYLDPPYASGRVYTSRLRLRGAPPVELGEQTEYGDIWEEADYLQFMAERLLLLRALLAENGTIWLHCDHRSQSRLHLLMEEVFGPDCYLNTIAWRSQTARGAKVHARYFPRSTHYIHIFARSSQARPVWHPPRREIVMTRAEAAARFMEDERGFFRTSHPGSYSFERLVELHAAGRLYAPHGGEIVVDHEQRRVYASKGGNIGVKYYVEKRGRNRYVVTRAVDSLWDDIPGLGTIPSEDVNYPTQKTAGLLRRILTTATNPGDLVLDPFLGSGTTVAVAEELGRRWLGCDDNWRAIRTTTLRCARTRTPYQVVGLSGATHPGLTQATPAEAAVRIDGQEGERRVRIVHFHSPDVAEAAASAGVPLPADWRAQVQAVLVDPSYGGEVFTPVSIDAPPGKQELVQTDHLVSLGEDGAHQPALLLVDVKGDEHLFVVRQN
ncbi:MAG: site-specific DNA-methyltransferase [Caldilineae bacterium]|nr:MAG: site-specific DNA-methyltransferase [Caldilineae bacterium]